MVCNCNAASRPERKIKGYTSEIEIAEVGRERFEVKLDGMTFTVTCDAAGDYRVENYTGSDEVFRSFIKNLVRYAVGELLGEVTNGNS